MSQATLGRNHHRSRTLRRPNSRRRESPRGGSNGGTLHPRQSAGRRQYVQFPSRGIADRDRSVLIRSMLEALGTPRALSVWLLYKYGEHLQLVQLAIDPAHYRERDVQKFRKDYAATKLLSKCSGLNTGVDLKQVALDSALEAEAQCLSTNRHIRLLRSGAVMHPLSSKWFEAKTIIAAILGPCPSWERLKDVGWSAGRTTSSYGEFKSPIDKYRSRPDVTRDARPAALRLLADSPLWGAALLRADGPCSVLPRGIPIVEGNVLITVPKNAKTDRVICYEPHMNIRLQLAVGGFIRRRLAKNGVDLNDQSVNQRRARLASKFGKLATIDLKMASDTLALELVWELLPYDWVCLLDSLRSKYTQWPDGSVRRNEKFSSMGNGFTFELESLIFYALARTMSENVSVYGDDIICSSEDFQGVCDLLEFSGFRINKAKSFGTGLFRESCGCDMFNGVDVTPPFIRTLPRVTDDIVKIHNAVRAWCARDFYPARIYANILKMWRNMAPSVVGPSGHGDGHYHVNWDESGAIRDRSGLEGWWFKTFLRLTREVRGGIDRQVGSFGRDWYYAVLSAAIGPKRSWNVYDQFVDQRRSVVRLRRVLASHWPDVYWGW